MDTARAGGAAPRLLLVEDNPDLVDLLVALLGAEGYHVDVARDGQAGLHRGLTRAYDVLLLDRGLPAVDGVDLLARLRRGGVRTAALILTAYGSTADRVSGLDAGADDYLVKPFDVDELLARLVAVRHRADGRDGGDVLPLGRDRTLHVTGRVVRSPDGTEIALSAKETELLAALARRPGKALSRRELLDLVFTTADGPGVVDTYVYTLRRKLDRDLVATVRGVGYRLGRR